jgi:flagellar assembly factor FliW
MDVVSIKSSQEGSLILAFPWGMPGLEDYRQFNLAELEGDSPFYYLSCVDQPEIGLLLVNPFILYKDYEFDLAEEAAAQLEIADREQIAVLCTVNTSRGLNSATVNLLAPIVVNTKQFLAKQVILSDRRYSLRAPLKINQGADKEVG